MLLSYKIGKFINADCLLNGGDELQGYNMFSYCGNNPVMKVDPTGEFALTALIVGAIIGAVIAFALTAYADYSDDGEVFNGSVSAGSYIANTLVGGVVGGFTGGTASSTLTFSVPTLSYIVTSTGETILIVATEVVSISGAEVVSALGVAVGGIYCFANRSKKEMSTDKPSWVNSKMIDTKKDAQQNAEDMLDNKYGKGNWRKGPKSEFNQIVKWLSRKIFLRGETNSE